jgi:putative hydrolase of the HAD superfamily
MSKKFDGVAFDLDGTLYPNYRFYIPLIPFMLKEQRLLRAFGKARDLLRVAAQEHKDQREGPLDTFYDIQARLIGDILTIDSGMIKERIEKQIYRGWEPLFKKIKPYPHVRETLQDLQKGGLKLGLLSDFPPEIKLENLNLNGFWDTVLCSERVGVLKPDPAPFLELIQKLEIPAERLLYVGNSVKYDIVGAKQVGMKAALVSYSLRKHRRHTGNADFIFSDYRQLSDYVLSW